MNHVQAQDLIARMMWSRGFGNKKGGVILAGEIVDKLEAEGAVLEPEPSLTGFAAAGVSYSMITIDLETSPTLLLYREGDETPIAAIHLDPKAECSAAGVSGHMVVREGEAV